MPVFAFASMYFNLMSHSQKHTHTSRMMSVIHFGVTFMDIQYVYLLCYSCVCENINIPLAIPPRMARGRAPPWRHTIIPAEKNFKSCRHGFIFFLKNLRTPLPGCPPSKSIIIIDFISFIHSFIHSKRLKIAFTFFLFSTQAIFNFMLKMCSWFLAAPPHFSNGTGRHTTHAPAVCGCGGERQSIKIPSPLPHLPL